jgi:ADP-L-glycero-D-manno-heptose 6-epimerase
VKILVTGHHGFIGQNMVRALTDHRVTTYEWGDPWPRLAGLDWVIHLGAISSTTERDVERIMRQNFDFSRDLLDACIELKINFQYASSASVYGLSRDFRESSPPDPRTPYAWSKWLFERHCRGRIGHARDKNIVIQGFRYFNVYGIGEDHKGSQASPVHQFRLQAETKGEITLFVPEPGEPDYARDFVPVEQIVDYHQRFWGVPESGVWNIGTGQARTFRSIAESFAVPVREQALPVHLKPGYQTWTCADMTHTQKTLEKYRITVQRSDCLGR